MKTIFNFYRKYLLGILLLSLISAGVFSQTTTYTVQPDPTAGKDAYINHKDASDTYGNNNCGTCTTIPGLRWTSGGIWFNGRSLMQFDLSSIPTNAIVTSAKLYLYGTGHSDLGGHGDSCNLFRITASWDESTVTYNNQPSHGTTKLQLPASTSSNQNYTVTVTSDVQSWVSSPSSNNGWIMISCAETYTPATSYEELQFFSSDYTTDATKRPKIEVTYCQQPTAGSNAPICSGHTLSLTSSTITSATYSWAGPNGFTSTSQNPTITNATTAASGTYTVTTTVGGTACTTHGTTSVTINQTTFTPTTSSNSPVCSGNTLSLSASTISGATYSWTGPNSFSSTSQNPTITNVTTAAQGTYSVIAIGTNGCPSATETAGPVTINATPSVTGTTPGSRCGTGTVALGATASAGTLNWYAASTGGSSLGTGTSFTTPSISSTTTYYVDATNNGCTTSSRTDRKSVV